MDMREFAYCFGAIIGQPLHRDCVVWAGVDAMRIAAAVLGTGQYRQIGNDVQTIRLTGLDAIATAGAPVQVNKWKKFA